MTAPSPIEMRDGYALFRATNEMSFDDVVEAVTSAIVSARAQGTRKLLIDISRVAEFDPPRHGHGHLFTNAWATAAQGLVLIAIVTERRENEASNNGVSVERSLSVVGNVFSTEKAAIEWLRRVE